MHQKKETVFLSFLSIGKFIKSKNTMSYDTTKKSAPKMPSLGTGTECVNLLLFRPQKTCEKPLFPMLSPYFVQKWASKKFMYYGVFWG